MDKFIKIEYMIVMNSLRLMDSYNKIYIKKRIKNTK